MLDREHPGPLESVEWAHDGGKPERSARMHDRKAYGRRWNASPKKGEALRLRPTTTTEDVGAEVPR